MKVSIQQKVLLEVLEKGGIAAVSEDAQADTSTLSLLIKSVKISADKHITVESNTDLLAVKNSVLASEENGINVKEEGFIVVPAKELISWVKNQGSESSIGIVLVKSATPEVINTIDSSDDPEASKFSINKIGVVRLTSKKNAEGKSSGKWELDCYDPDQKASVNFTEKSDKSFEVNGKAFVDALNNVRFAALPKDHEHVLDSISMQVHENNLYFAASDMQHCALYKMPKEAVVEILSSNPLLIPSVILEQVSKIIDDDKFILSYSEEKNRVYFSQTNLRIRVACTEKEHVKKFPSIEVLLKKPYKPLVSCSKNIVNDLLIDASLVNKTAALLVFAKDNGTITIKAISQENKHRPSLKQATLDNTISTDAKLVLGVDHLLDELKVIKADEIEFGLPDNLKSVKINGKGDENLTCFMMCINNPKYNEE